MTVLDRKKKKLAKTTKNKQLLKKLANDHEWIVREQVSKNLYTPQKTLIKLASDPDVGDLVSENANASPGEALALLAESKIRQVKKRVANHKNTTKKILIKLANDNDVVVRESAYLRLSIADIPKKYKDDYRKIHVFKIKQSRKLKGKFVDNDLYLLYLKSLKEGWLTWDKIKKLPYNSTNIIKKFKKYTKGKSFSNKDIFKFNKLVLNSNADIMSWIKNNVKTTKVPVKSSLQIIFNKSGHIMQLNIPYKKFEEFNKLAGLSKQEKESLKFQVKNHPTSKKDYTLGWVRYTILSPKEVWIDEIQSDWQKKLKNKEFLRKIKNINDVILQKFIQVAHKLLGVEKIYIPSIEIKRETYKTSPLISVYKEVPRKARFKKSSLKKEGIKIPRIKKNYSVWVLSAKEQKFLNKLCKETGLRLNINHKIVKACIKFME